MELIRELLKELRELPDGTETDLFRLLKAFGNDPEAMEKDGELFTVCEKLLKAARRAQITLVWHAPGNTEILSYNAPFTVRNDAAQVKCPRCGGRNTASIYYGLPGFSEELEAKMEAGRVRLGGCRVTGADAPYYCNECRKSFGAPGKFTREGNVERFTDGVMEVRFSRTPSRSPEREILRIRKTGTHARVTAQDGALPPEEYRISGVQWDNLVHSLYGRLYLNDWKRRLEDPDVLDGEKWELTVLLAGGRKRVYSGRNAFPPYWEELESLLGRFRRDRRA